MEEERALGWIDQNSLAYSPRIEKVAWVPRGEYDEWYTFLTSARINMPEVFVNDSGFTLRDPRQDLKNLDPTWDKKMHVEWSEIILEKQFRFWRQMQAIMPESYIAEGDRLIFVTNSLGHYEAIRQHFQKRT